MTLEEMAREAVILDTETNTLKGLPIEIAFGYTQINMNDKGLPELDYAKDEVFHQFYSIRGEPIDYAAMAVHHIIEDDIAGMPDYTEFGLPDSVKYIIGHNIDYDIQAIQKCGVETSHLKSICTLAMAREIYPELQAHNLSALLYFIYNGRGQIRDRIKNAHSAKVDIGLTALLLRHFVSRTGIENMEDLYAFSEQARIPKVMYFGKHKGASLCDLPPSYVSWLLNQEDVDPYLRKALQQL